MLYILTLRADTQVHVSCTSRYDISFSRHQSAILKLQGPESNGLIIDDEIVVNAGVQTVGKD